MARRGLAGLDWKVRLLAGPSLHASTLGLTAAADPAPRCAPHPGPPIMVPETADHSIFLGTLRSSSVLEVLLEFKISMVNRGRRQDPPSVPRVTVKTRSAMCQVSSWAQSQELSSTDSVRAVPISWGRKMRLSRQRDSQP